VRLAWLALAVLAADLGWILVTGTRSVGGGGFLLRIALLALLIVIVRRRRDPGRTLLVLLLLPTLAQFQFAGGRINGDGIMYYSYVRSLMKDGDLDLANEYDHYGLLTRGDLSMPTKTGLRRSIFSVGPALVWAPFFLAGEVAARLQAFAGSPVDLSGYGPHHRNAVALGSLLYGFAALLLIHGLLRRHFTAATAVGATLLVWGATFLHWYMVQQPTMSHAVSTFAAALAVWLWDRERGSRGFGGHLLLGLVFGLAMCIRWQNGLFLLLPGFDLLRRWRRHEASWRAVAAAGSGLLLGALIGAFPQMAAWKALYDMWVLPYPPHGADFVRFDHPFFPQTFFSSRHGLLSWTPIFWAGYLGFLPLLKRRPQIAWPLLAPLLMMTYVNLCSGDWWAGGSFSNRRFDSLLPVLAFGFAAAIDVSAEFIRRRPEVALAAIALPFTLWNAALMEQVRRGLVPRDDTVAFPRLAGNAARLVASAVGSPPTWPASWLFAWRYRLNPGQYDLLVGRYLFYRQNNLGGHVEVGAPGDEAMLGEGWGPVESKDGVNARRVRGRARLFAPLDVPEDLEVHFRAAAVGEGAPLEVAVNGKPAGQVWASSNWSDHSLRVAAPFWRRELNEVALTAAQAPVMIDAVRFARVASGG
jgi:hypothetical protein